MRQISIFCILVLLFSTAGCFQQPEGPAERLGKTIDQLNQNLQDLSEEYDTKQKEEEAVRERERSRVKDDYYGSDRDPYYAPDRGDTTSQRDRY